MAESEEGHAALPAVSSAQLFLARSLPLLHDIIKQSS